MPRLPYETRNAPTGYDSTNSPTMLQPNRAILVRNLVADSVGVLRGTLAWEQIKQFVGGVDGLFYYQGDTSDDDRLLVVSGGFLYSSPLDTLVFTPAGSGFDVGASVRAASFDDEMFFVQDGGIQPLRFNGENLYQLGMDAPPAPIAQAAAPTTGTTVKTGTVSYRARYYDEKSRESEPSESVSLTFTATTYDGHITLFSSWEGVDPQVKGAYIEATTAGGSTYYRIATLERASNEVFYEDNLTSAQVQAGTTSTGIGRRSVPNKASAICAHKNYLWMNDTESARQLQISSLNAPTYFPTVTEVAASDGGRMTIPGARGGNPIVQLTPFGSLLTVMLKQGIVHIFGTSLSNFQPRELHIRGTVSPGSVARVDNGVWFLLDTSVYNMDYEGNFINNKVSQEIDADLRAHTAAERRNALAVYCKNRYLLHVGGIFYCFDFTAGGWTQIVPDTSRTTQGEVASLQALSDSLQVGNDNSSSGSSGGAGSNAVVPSGV